MQVVSRKTLLQFWERHADSKEPLSVWFVAASKAEWKTPQDIKDQFGAVDFVGDNRAIFNIGGNKYRLIVHISYTYKGALIKFVGTHAAYDRINAETI